MTFNATLKALTLTVLLSCAAGRQEPGPTMDSPGESRGAAGKPIAAIEVLEPVGLGTYRALIIGVDEYDDSETWGALTTAEKDAQDIHDRLVETYGFEPENTDLLLGADATLARVKEGLKRLRAESQREDLVFIYYAGHGDFQDDFDGEKEGGCWILQDGKGRECENNVLSVARLRDSFLQHINAQHLLVVSDSCFSGALASARMADTRPAANAASYRADLRKRSIKVLVSGDNDRTVNDTGGIDGHSPFASAILKRLETPDHESGFVSAQDLFESVRHTYKTEKLSYKANLAEMQDQRHDGGDFVFIPKADQAALRATPTTKADPGSEQVAHLESKLSASERMATVLKLQQKAKKLEEDGLTTQAAALWRAALSLDQGEDLTGGFGESSLPGLHGIETFGSVLKGHNGAIYTLAFNHDGSRLVTGSGDNTAIVWNMETFKKIKTLEGHDDWIHTLAFNHDGSRLVTGSDDSTAIVWNMETFEQIKTLEGHQDYIRTLAFNHDGSRLVTGSGDTTAIVWNMETFEPIKTLKGHEDDIRTLAFNHDGTRLVTGSADNTAIVWNMLTFEQIKTLDGHKEWIDTLAFSPDGSRLVTGSYDKTAIVWNMETFEQIKTLEGHEKGITTLAFSPDGLRLVTGSSDGTAIVWNMETLTLPVPEFLTETGALTNLRVCRDSLKLKVVPIAPMPAPETVWVDESIPAAEALAACAD
jgi:hypothetical protein